MLKFAKAPQVVGFSPNARRDVEVEIVRMLPAVTPGEPARLPPNERPKKMRKKSDLAACNTLERPWQVRQFFKALGLSAGFKDESTRSQDSRAPHF